MSGDSSPATGNGQFADDEVYAHEDLRGQVEDINHRVESLEARVDQGVQAMRENLREQISELTATVEALEARCDRLESDVESLTGLTEDQDSTPERRARDVRQMMANQCEAKADRDGRSGTVAWTYQDILKALESNGHGSLHPPQAYAVMEQLDQLDAFAEVKNAEGDRVIRTSLDALTADGGVNEINNADPVEGGVEPPNSTSTM